MLASGEGSQPEPDSGPGHSQPEPDSEVGGSQPEPDSGPGRLRRGLEPGWAMGHSPESRRVNRSGSWVVGSWREPLPSLGQRRRLGGWQSWGAGLSERQRDRFWSWGSDLAPG